MPGYRQLAYNYSIETTSLRQISIDYSFYQTALGYACEECVAGLTKYHVVSRIRLGSGICMLTDQADYRYRTWLVGVEHVGRSNDSC